MRRRLKMSTLVATLAAAAVAGCGSSSGTSTSASSVSSTSAAATTPGLDFTKVRQCLQAAGISLPSPPAGGLPSGLPSGFPQGQGFSPPAGVGGGGFLNNPQARAALNACGITLPGAPPTP